jgi:hypothetical protein
MDVRNTLAGHTEEGGGCCCCDNFKKKRILKPGNHQVLSN